MANCSGTAQGGAAPQPWRIPCFDVLSGLLPNLHSRYPVHLLQRAAAPNNQLSSVELSGGLCVNPNPLLYATRTTNKVLPFSISPSGSLTALTPAAGPVNSGSVANLGHFLMFADPSSNEVASDQISSDGNLTKVAVIAVFSRVRCDLADQHPGRCIRIFLRLRSDGTIVSFSTRTMAHSRASSIRHSLRHRTVSNGDNHAVAFRPPPDCLVCLRRRPQRRHSGVHHRQRSVASTDRRLRPSALCPTGARDHSWCRARICLCFSPVTLFSQFWETV